MYVQNRTSFTSNASKTFWVTFCELVLLTYFFKVASAPSKKSQFSSHSYLASKNIYRPASKPRIALFSNN